MIGLKNFCILYTFALYGDKTLLDSTMNSFIPSGQSVVVIDVRHKLTLQPNGMCEVIGCETVISKFCLVFFMTLPMSIQLPVLIKLIAT